MKNIYKITAFLVVLSLILPIAIAQAEYIYTSVKFNNPLDLSFQVTLPSAGAPNISAPGGNSTEDVWFNATSANDKWIQPCRIGGSDCQDSATPLYLVKNIGSVQMNLSISWVSTPNAAYTTFVNMSIPAGSGTGCTGYALGLNNSVIPTDPTWFNFVNGTCVNNETNLFVTANFTNAPAGENSYLLNISSGRYS